MDSMSMIIDGSHFGGILRAVDRLMSVGYHARDVELVCDSETEEYVLRLLDEEHTVIATIPY